MAWSLCFTGILMLVTFLRIASSQEAYQSELPTTMLNCTPTDEYVSFHPTNASRLDETKLFQHRSSKDESQDQRFSRKYQDQREHLNVDDFGKHTNGQQTKKYFNMEDVNRNIKVQPLHSRLDDQRQIENPSLNRNSDHLSGRYYDNQISKKNLVDQSTDDQRLKSKLNDEYVYKDQEEEISNRRYFNKYNNRYVDDLQPDKDPSDENFDRHLIDPRPDSRLIDQNFGRRPTNQQSDKFRDNLQPNRHLEDDSFERHAIEQPVRHFDDQETTRKLFDDLPLERRFDEPKDNYENPNKDVDNLHLDRRFKDQNFEKHNIDQISNNDGDSDKKFDEDYDHHLANQNHDRHREGQYPGNELESVNPDRRLENPKILEEETTIIPRKESNASHLMTFTLSKDWDESKPKLHFPKKSGNERYKMTTLYLDKGLFLFDFLRKILSIIQPRNVPLETLIIIALPIYLHQLFEILLICLDFSLTVIKDLLKDTLEGKVNVSTLITQTVHLEIVFIAVISVFIVMMFVLPSTELWLCCRPNRYSYQRQRHGTLLFFLIAFSIIIGSCVVTMLICNEEVSVGIERIPETVEAALQDLRDYHSGTVMQLRKCLTRSLDVASEAILADLDNVEDLLGKPIQAQLSSETGVDEILDTLMDVANSSTELAFKTDVLLKRAERARDLGLELSRETDEIRRDIELTTRDCAVEDRSLCAVLDPTGLHLALRLERVVRDDRLLRLRAAGRDNLTETGRQARGEYLYVPHHIARSTLDARNQIRREISTARAKVSDEARGIEARGSDLTNHLDTVRRTTNEVQPYIKSFEYKRWLIGFGTGMCVLLVWLLLFGALCCRCGPSEDKVRPTLLWFVFLSCIVSMGLWLVLIAGLAIASHAELLLCRPLDDPEYRTVEAILETKVFLGRRLSVPLKDLFEKCEEKDAAYPAFQLDNTLKLEQLTAHWTWSGLTRGFAKLKVDLTGLRILTPNLRERLQNLLYASGPNLTEHRIMIQGPILNKDLTALSDQVENVARQLTDRRTARSFQTLAAQMRDLLSRRVKPLMKMQDDLVYQLAALELHMQPLQRQVNQTLTQLRTIQYYIDSQGDKIGQLKTKAYIDRMGSYLDQWRAHVLTEVNSGVSKCRPLWDILQGIKLLFCSHILGPLNGYWFATLICVLSLLICTPSAHTIATSYWKPPSSKGSVLLSRQGSPDTVVVERETWRTPDPPPSMDSW